MAVADASITDDNRRVVVAVTAAVDKSTTDEGRIIVEGDESVIVNEMFDELTKVDGSAVDDVSNGTVFSYITVSFDQIWRARPSSAVEAPALSCIGQETLSLLNQYKSPIVENVEQDTCMDAYLDFDFCS